MNSQLRNACVVMLIILALSSNAQIMSSTKKEDLAELSKLNAMFITNFVHQDTVSHNKIIHQDFVCIESSGAIVRRSDYMKEWATGYDQSGYKTFKSTDELIRLFGSTALVRSRTIYTKEVNGQTITGGTIYTDTYVKEKGRWWCVQAQITPIRTNTN